MKKRVLMLLLAACLMLNLLPSTAFAEEVEGTAEAAADPNAKSGSCGEGLSWVLDGYTLTISGSGEMEDGAPWEAHKDHIEHVVLTGGVTKIGAEAFYGYDRIETVDFGDALVEIGAKAFYGCEDIDIIHLPKTFRIFGAEAFRGCTSLQKVYCDGGMPRFNDSCLWTGNYIAVFYPTNNPWSFEYTQPLVSSYGGNLGVMMGNYDAAALQEEETEETEAVEEPAEEETKPAETTEATEVPTEAAVVVIATEPETVPVTEPVTEPVKITVPETEEPTVPATEAEETVEATEETEPETVVEKVGGDGWIGMVMIAAVITFLLSGAMIFRSLSHKGGRYKG